MRQNHKDYNQVVMDVRRSLRRFPKGQGSGVTCCVRRRSTTFFPSHVRWFSLLCSSPVLLCSAGMRAEERAVLQEQLVDIILDVLLRNPPLHYYQGFHDIAVTFLLVVGERMAIPMVETLSNHHLRYDVSY